MAERSDQRDDGRGFHAPEDLNALDPGAAIGFPGQFPFTRGIRPAGYRGRLWTMRQYAGFGTAEESNRRYHQLLEAGQTGLSVAFDLPTQMGYDSDHALAAGEVGKSGVAIDSIQDMERLLDGIPLERVSISMTINATAAILLGLLLGVARRRGVPWDRLRGTVQNDILKEYQARGTYMLPPDGSLRLVTDIIAFCEAEVPRWNPISISGYHIREAGSTAVQEVAFTLGNAIAYVEAVLGRGLDIDAFAGRLSFFFNAHNDFLEEIAKFRAARRLWARIVKDRFRATQARSMQLRFHAQTGGSTLTAQDPMNNVVRVTLQALAAVLGGTQSLHTNSLDEALSLPSEEAARLALRTQQVIAEESGVTSTVDPCGGAYTIEAETARIEREAMAYIEKIDRLGGMRSAIEQGYVQNEINEAAYRAQQAVESGAQGIVGVNRHPGTVPGQVEFQVETALEPRQVERLRSERDGRESGKWRAAVERLDADIAGDANLLPAIIDAVDVGVTLGEIAARLRARYGQYRDSTR